MFEILILIAGVIAVPLYFYWSEVSLRLKCKHTYTVSNDKKTNRCTKCGITK